MATKYFQKILMESETVGSQCRTGVYYVGATPTTVGMGAFVKVSGLADNTTYSGYVSGTKDLNKLVVIAPAADTDKGIYVVDAVKVSDGTINGNIYREGAKTLGLTAAAGEIVRIRKVNEGDMFELGDDNFTGAVTVGQYAILGTTVSLVPSANIVTTKLTVKIEQVRDISQGTTANVKGYICRVVNL